MLTQTKGFDDQDKVDAPHWEKGRSDGSYGEGYPVCYVRDKNVSLKAKIKVEPSTYTGQLIIQPVVSGPNLGYLPQTNTVSGGYVNFNMAASTNKLPNSVQKYNPMSISWNVSFPEPNGASSSAGTSTNQLYVVLGTPSIGGTPLFHTLIDIACQNSVGETEESAILTKIWSVFSSRTTKNAFNQSMKYWGDDAKQNAASNNEYGNVFGLLKHRDGTCSAWSRLMREAVRTHGLSSLNKYTIAHTNSLNIAIKSSLSGQNNTTPNKYFENHALVKTAIFGDDRIYDPSYGYATTLGENQWENHAIDFFYRGNDLDDKEENTNNQQTIWTQEN